MSMFLTDVILIRNKKKLPKTRSKLNHVKRGISVVITTPINHLHNATFIHLMASGVNLQNVYTTLSTTITTNKKGRYRCIYV